MIVDLGPDDVIREPGFYRMPIERHHGQPCDGVSVTSGILRKMELQTPADVWAFHMLNPDRWPSQETDALRLGRAMAAFVEGGMEAVGEHFLVLPADKPRRPTTQQVEAYDAGRATDAGRASVEFWRSIDADPRQPLTDAEVQMILNMGTVLAADPAAAAAMGGEPEITMAWRDDVTGLWVLSRPDTVSFDGTMSDYKKVSARGEPFSAHLIDRRIEKHGYHMQMALAAESFERLTREWPGIVSIVAQSDVAPHHVILREISEEMLRIGQWQNRRALSRFKECLDSGHWPGPGEDVGQFRPSEGWWQRMQNEMQLGAAE